MIQPILVVDDDVAILEGIVRVLKQADFAVVTASSGNQAKAHIAQSTLPALVVLDVLMPVCDGFEVCRAIRSLSTYVPVLMLSALDAVTDKVIGLEVGADDYLAKPFDPRELIARVRALTRIKSTVGVASIGDTPLVCGTICLWPERHLLKINDCSVALPPKEWALLAFLLHHPNKVFGREMLLREVWGYTYMGDSRTVDVHMQRLRARLAEHQADHCIQTVRGFGYRLIPPSTIVE